MSNNSFTLDIGEKNIKVADISKNGKLYRADALAMGDSAVNIYNSDDKKAETAVPIIKKLVDDSGITKKIVNIIIPNTFSYSRLVETPVLTEKELISAIRYQADQFIPVPIDKVNMDIEIISEVQNDKLLILLVASQTTVLQRITGIIEAAGLMPDSIETEASATISMLSDLELPESAIAVSQYILFANFGYSSSSLYLFDKKNNIPLEIYNFPLGFNLFIKDLMVNYSLSEPEASNLLQTYNFTKQEGQYKNINQIMATPLSEFSKEIEKFLISVKNRMNISINSLIIFGEVTKINQFDSRISSFLGIPATPIDLYPLFNKNNTVDFFKNDLGLFIPSIGGNLK
jgi:type IV pilus assembly protein PilM